MAQINAYGQQIVAERKAYQATFAVPGSETLRATFLNDLNDYQAAIVDAGKLVASGNPSGALVMIETRLKNGSKALQQDIDGLDNLMRQHAERNYAESSQVTSLCVTAWPLSLAAVYWSPDCRLAVVRSLPARCVRARVWRNQFQRVD